ncbi:hypothetical protein HanXRQr2_Chr15g0685721 [Helianthus annuus]|uniref:Uncharacterized protein n=1 Tax=Helianthus annuus TaxID=4232 RepID=A0A251S816_HELAN|nr:hypothetical protein HanXRQr2_Chr15g0685721 [Helianthus annuus]KAJ0830639.1 hypothetical protein HanPSC8_Chr15g0657701 [Helianthus annuus]
MGPTHRSEMAFSKLLQASSKVLSIRPLPNVTNRALLRNFKTIVKKLGTHLVTRMRKSM